MGVKFDSVNGPLVKCFWYSNCHIYVKVLEFVKSGSCYDAAIKYRVSPAVVFKWKADQKKAEEQSPSNLALQALNQQMLEWYKDYKLKGKINESLRFPLCFDNNFEIKETL